MKALLLLALLLLAAPASAHDRLYFDGDVLVLEPPLAAGEKQVAQPVASPEQGWAFTWTYTFRAAGDVAPDFGRLRYTAAAYSVTLPVLPNPEEDANEPTCSQ